MGCLLKVSMRGLDKKYPKVVANPKNGCIFALALAT